MIDNIHPRILDRFSLNGLVAVVAGGSGSIGAAAARAFAEAGADVALVARDRGKLDKAAAHVAETGCRVAVVEADVTNEASVTAASAKILREFGRADILFNNAGTTTPKALVDLSADEWHRVLDVNLTGAYRCTRAFVPAMMERRHGRIINMGSVLSARGMAYRTVYCASKAGLANFAAALSFELAPFGITVNTLGATVIETDLNRDLIHTQPALYDDIRRRIPIGRLGELDDLTGALVFLASSASSFMTGQTLYVDGGYTAG